MTTIDALYPGTCPECGGRFDKGDRIRLDAAPGARGFWRHDVCPDDPGPLDLRKGESVCETCWLVHPAGACDR